MFSSRLTASTNLAERSATRQIEHPRADELNPADSAGVLGTSTKDRRFGQAPPFGSCWVTRFIIVLRFARKLLGDSPRQVKKLQKNPSDSLISKRLSKVDLHWITVRCSPRKPGFYPKCVISVIRLLETSAAPLLFKCTQRNQARSYARMHDHSPTLVTRTLPSGCPRTDTLSSRAAALMRDGNSAESLVGCCRVSVSLALPHSSDSTCPTGADMSACGRNPLSWFPSTQRHHAMSRLRQWLPSLITRLNLFVARNPRTRLVRME
jgi:hypothetical protein